MTSVTDGKFTLERLSSRVWKIVEADPYGQFPFIYVVLGGDKCILIDTGCGGGNLRAFVDLHVNRERLPYLIVNTHVHFDVSWTLPVHLWSGLEEHWLELSLAEYPLGVVCLCLLRCLRPFMLSRCWRCFFPWQHIGGNFLFSGPNAEGVLRRILGLGALEVHQAPTPGT